MQPATLSKSKTNSLLDRPFHYIEKGIKAEGHTPIYKMHRYFARRPHNVFRYLIESYTRPGDVVLDCFCGGGVTVVEGLTTGRKVVGVDLNPLATFVTESQVTPVEVEDYRTLMREVWGKIRALSKKYYVTRCRKCRQLADVRWFELAYRAICPKCGARTLLSNENKATRSANGRTSGYYNCQKCHFTFAAVNARRDGHELVSVVYKCPCTHGRRSAPPNKEDTDIMEGVEEDFDDLVKAYDLWYPNDRIPEDWDRQEEDALSRKSIYRFSDLFTRRNLFFNAYLLKCFRSYKDKVSPALYKMLIFTFSAIIRYTNNMTFSASNWMDGRPISWDKHAYWIPNQFVEVNPIEYFEKRRNAIISGLKYQHTSIAVPRQVDSFARLVHGDGTHIVWTRSSDKLPLPDESIDAIITDPPYGSNVQYGELSYYWLVWLRDELRDYSPSWQENEIVVHRRANGPARKSYDSYFGALKKVFAECHRVLKRGGVLAFTFNNKDLKAWYSVLKAAEISGFHLDKRGIVYQEPIENYLNTSHTRFAGSLHGDFIHTFRKAPKDISENYLSARHQTNTNLRNEIMSIATDYLRAHNSATTNQLYVEVMKDLIPRIVSIEESKGFSWLCGLAEMRDLDAIFRDCFVWDGNRGLWRLPQL